jgi:hypothetical protein
MNLQVQIWGITLWYQSGLLWSPVNSQCHTVTWVSYSMASERFALRTVRLDPRCLKITQEL